MVLAPQRFIRLGIVQRAEAERIHHGQRARVHGKDVAQDAAHAGGRALVGLDVAGMVVALDLEGACPAVADVDDARVLARALDYRAWSGRPRALGRQALQVDAAGLVGAVLRPHDGEDAQLGKRGRAAHQLFDARVLVRGDAMRLQQRGSDLGWRGYGARNGGSRLACRRTFRGGFGSRRHSSLLRLSHVQGAAYAQATVANPHFGHLAGSAGCAGLASSAGLAGSGAGAAFSFAIASSTRFLKSP